MSQVLDIERKMCSLCWKVRGERYEIKDVGKTRSSRALETTVRILHFSLKEILNRERTWSQWLLKKIFVYHTEDGGGAGYSMAWEDREKVIAMNLDLG